MAVRLGGLLGPRTHELGFGVRVQMRAIGYADIKAAEHHAVRQARARIMEMRDAQDETRGDLRRFEEDALAMADAILLDTLVERFGIGWDGVMQEDGVTPAPLTPETWAAFRDGLPFLADALRAALRTPVDMVILEGEPSAP